VQSVVFLRFKNGKILNKHPAQKGIIQKGIIMKAIKSFVQSYAVLAYFVLTFAITWGSILILTGASSFPLPSEKIESAGPLVYVGMLIGPSISGLLLIGIVEGKSGFRSLFSRLGKWRVSGWWYVIALLTAPLLILAILLLLSLSSSEYAPAILTTENPASLLVTGVVMGLFVAFLEELGWTGFVVPKLRQKNGLVTTGIIVGVLWGAWHYPPFSASVRDSGSLSPTLYLAVLLFSFLPVYRLLLVWIYERTGSLLLVILMHAPLSASQLVLIPPPLSGPALVTYDLIFALILLGLFGIAVFVPFARSEKVEAQQKGA
jgi:membrane protease YdiL (CAAX protease family)